MPMFSSGLPPIEKNDESLKQMGSLFVGDLPFGFTSGDFLSLFQSFGDILECKIMRGDSTGKSLSYGFVTFSSHEDAQKVIEKQNGMFVQGRKLRINWASYKSQTCDGGVKKGSTSDELFTSEIHVSFKQCESRGFINEEILRALFSEYGDVTDVAIKKIKELQEMGGTRYSGYAFVHYPSTEEGITASLKAVRGVQDLDIDGVNYRCFLSHKLTNRLQKLDYDLSDIAMPPRLCPLPASVNEQKQHKALSKAKQQKTQRPDYLMCKVEVPQQQQQPHYQRQEEQEQEARYESDPRGARTEMGQRQRVSISRSNSFSSAVSDISDCDFSDSLPYPSQLTPAHMQIHNRTRTHYTSTQYPSGDGSDATHVHPYVAPYVTYASANHGHTSYPMQHPSSVDVSSRSHPRHQMIVYPSNLYPVHASAPHGQQQQHLAGGQGHPLERQGPCGLGMYMGDGQFLPYRDEARGESRQGQAQLHHYPHSTAHHSPSSLPTAMPIHAGTVNPHIPPMSHHNSHQQDMDIYHPYVQALNCGASSPYGSPAVTETYAQFQYQYASPSEAERHLQSPYQYGPSSGTQRYTQSQHDAFLSVHHSPQNAYEVSPQSAYGMPASRTSSGYHLPGGFMITPYVSPMVQYSPMPHVSPFMHERALVTASASHGHNPRQLAANKYNFATTKQANRHTTKSGSGHPGRAPVPVSISIPTGLVVIPPTESVEATVDGLLSLSSQTSHAMREGLLATGTCHDAAAAVAAAISVAYTTDTAVANTVTGSSTLQSAAVAAVTGGDVVQETPLVLDDESFSPSNESPSTGACPTTDSSGHTDQDAPSSPVPASSASGNNSSTSPVKVQSVRRITDRFRSRF
jgi:cold-inducible RNA-binding protein